MVGEGEADAAIVGLDGLVARRRAAQYPAATCHRHRLGQRHQGERGRHRAATRRDGTGVGARKGRMPN